MQTQQDPTKQSIKSEPVILAKKVMGKVHVLQKNKAFNLDSVCTLKFHKTSYWNFSFEVWAYLGANFSIT